MRVFMDHNERCCDNCDKRAYVYNIHHTDGTVMVCLCKECLMKLLKAIIERD